jgi:hypothetical protein
MDWSNLDEVKEAFGVKDYSANVEWSDVPKDAEVLDLRTIWIAKVKNTWACVCWSTMSASLAHAKMMRLTDETKKRYNDSKNKEQ